MLLSEIIATVRDELDDKVPPFLWTDIDIVRYANRSQNELATKARVIVDSTTTAITQIAVVAGTEDYALDSRIVAVKRCRLASQARRLIGRSVYYLDNHKVGWELDSAATPIFYLLDRTTGFITIHPKPVLNDVLLMTVNRIPLVQLDVNSLNNSPEIPVRHHNDLIIGVLSYAYNKKDTDHFDPRKTLMYRQEWMKIIDDIKNSEAIDITVDTNQDPNPDYMDEIWPN